jgi:hypothetical protein
LPNQYPQLLHEKFPHVLEKIVEPWNSHDGEDYFHDPLQSNGRGGGRLDRHGFPEKVWWEIYSLNELYKKPRRKSAKWAQRAGNCNW